ERVASDRNRTRRRRTAPAPDARRAALAAPTRADPVTVQPADVRSRHARDHRTNPGAGGRFSLVERSANCFHGRFDIDDHTLAKTGARRDAVTQKSDLAFGAHVGDQGAHLAGPNIQSSEQVPHGVTDSWAWSSRQPL